MATMKILRKIYLKIDDYYNFSSTCKVKMSIHLLFNSAVIKKFKITQVNVEDMAKS